MSDHQDWRADNPEFEDGNEIPDEELRFAPVEQSNLTEPDEDSLEAEFVAEKEESERTFEDLTLAELVGQFMRSPRRTWRALTTITRAERSSTSVSASPIPTPVRRVATEQTATKPLVITKQEVTDTPIATRDRVASVFTSKLSPKQVQLGLYLIAVVVGIIGSTMLLGSGEVRRTEDNALVIGAPFLWIAFFLWLGAELYGNWSSLVRWWSRIDRLTQVRWVARIVPLFVWLTALFLFTDAMTAPAESALGLVQIGIGRVLIGLIIWVLIEVGVWLIRHMARTNPDFMTGWV